VSDAPTAFASYPSGWRSLQLPDSTVGSYFLQTFGRPERVITSPYTGFAERDRLDLSGQ